VSTWPARILSGGQTGVDRAALDAAVAAGVPYGGWCPAGGTAEDLPGGGLLEAYPGLRPTDSDDPALRTRLNVRDSTAVLVVAPVHLVAGGTLLTVDEAARLERRCLVATGPVERVVEWIEALEEPRVLDVAGPRASEWPEGYDVARALLDEVLRIVVADHRD
jgi:hypothetical protein